MKRILSILLSFALLFSPFAPILQQAQAEDVQVLVASGTVAAADIAVTLTAGSADVDLSSATIPRNYKGNLLKIYDAANVCIQGFPYTNGAGTVQNIVSTKGGTTRNWSQQGAGFDDTTNCRYEIWKVLDAPVVATATVTAGKQRVDTTTANAFAALYAADGTTAIDLSAYQDGKHILAMYNTTGGYAAIAKIKAEAPAAEGLTGNLATNGDNEAAAMTPQALTRCTAAQSADFAHAGTYSLKVTSNGAGGNSYNYKIDNSGGGVPVAGALYKQDVWGYNPTTNGNANIGPTWDVGGSSILGTAVATKDTWLNFVNYVTAAQSGTNKFGGIQAPTNNAGLIFYADDISVPRVTECAATGLHLTSDWTNRGFIYLNSSFNPNLEFTYKILYVGD